MRPMRIELVTALGIRRELAALLDLGVAAVYLVLGQHQPPHFLAVTGVFLLFSAFQLLLAFITPLAPSRRVFVVGFVGLIERFVLKKYHR